MLGFSYWMLPVLSGLAWLSMLMAMLIGWTAGEHRVHYVSMDADQTVAYISDIGASGRFKPMFIALSCVTTGLLDLSMLADRWLRHRRRLTPNSSTAQKLLAVLELVFALAGTAGLVLLSVFDVAHHQHLHDGFLVLFLVGFIISAIFACAEFQRLGIHNRDKRILRASFWIKLVFILLEIALAVTFVCLSFANHATKAACVEWTIAFLFAFYVFSYAIDLYPAVHTRHGNLLPPAAHAKTAAQGSSSNASTGDGDRPPYPPATPAEMEAARPPQDAFTYSAAANYDGAYGQSAARATRPVRSRPIPASQPGPATGPAATSQSSNWPSDPSRTYGHRQELLDTM